MLSTPDDLSHVAFSRRHLLSLSFAAALCAVTARVDAQTVDAKKPFAAFSASAQSLTDSIVAKARSQIGTRYKLGGLAANRALDCSGLVKVVMSALNMVLPRTARQQATMGEEIPKDLAALKPGDLLTFGRGKKISHIGIYVGEGRMVHASTSKHRVAAAGPLSLEDIQRRMPEGSDAGRAIEAVRTRYAGRGVELETVAGRFRLRTAPDLAWLMTEEREEPRRLSKAALETLAIIAYHQPVTRADIEQVRGVSLNRGTLDLLLEMGFARLRGRRRSPGRPVTYGTTDLFLEQFSLANLGDLPGAAEMKAAGLLDMGVPAGFEVPDPSRADDGDLLSMDDGDDDAPEFHQDFVGGEEP